MGTTTTPNLGLIKPDGNEPGANFPAQHAANMDTLDDFDGMLDAVAGTILAAGMRPITQENASTDAIASTTFVHSTNGVGYSFVAPPSGQVRIDLYAGLVVILSSNVSRSLYSTWELREGASVGSGTIVVNAGDNNGVYVRVGATSGMEAAIRATAHKIQTGLTPGATYNIRTMHRMANATTGTSTADDFVRRLTVTPLP